MERDPQTRKLGERYIYTADAVLDETTERNPMHTDDHVEEAVAERRERNRRWDRDDSRDTALAELVNEAAIPLWEPRPAVQPRARRGASGPVLDDF